MKKEKNVKKEKKFQKLSSNNCIILKMLKFPILLIVKCTAKKKKKVNNCSVKVNLKICTKKNLPKMSKSNNKNFHIKNNLKNSSNVLHKKI